MMKSCCCVLCESSFLSVVDGDGGNGVDGAFIIKGEGEASPPGECSSSTAAADRKWGLRLFLRYLRIDVARLLPPNHRHHVNVECKKGISSQPPPGVGVGVVAAVDWEEIWRSLCGDCGRLTSKFGEEYQRFELARLQVEQCVERIGRHLAESGHKAGGSNPEGAGLKRQVLLKCMVEGGIKRNPRVLLEDIEVKTSVVPPKQELNAPLVEQNDECVDIDIGEVIIKREAGDTESKDAENVCVMAQVQVSSSTTTQPPEYEYEDASPRARVAEVTCQNFIRTPRYDFNKNQHFRSSGTKRRGLICRTCGKCFTSVRSLQIHVRNHNNNVSFNKDKHGPAEDSSKRVFPCPHCWRTLASKHTLREHQRLAHFWKSVPGGATAGSARASISSLVEKFAVVPNNSEGSSFQFQCPFCTRQNLLNNKWNCKRHLLYAHTDVVISSIKAKAKEPPEASPKLKCQHCSTVSTNAKEHQSHVLCNHPQFFAEDLPKWVTNQQLVSVINRLFNTCNRRWNQSGGGELLHCSFCGSDTDTWLDPFEWRVHTLQIHQNEVIDILEKDGCCPRTEHEYEEQTPWTPDPLDADVDAAVEIPVISMPEFSQPLPKRARCSRRTPVPAKDCQAANLNCYYCEKPFTERINLLRHLINLHPGDFFAKCLKPETTREEVAAAIETAYGSIIMLDDNDNWSYQCPHCTGGRYKGKNECRLHILLAHPDDVFSTLKIQAGTSIKTSVIDEFSSAAQGVRCELCGVVTGSLRFHMLAKHPFLYYQSKLPKGTSEQELLEALDSLTKLATVTRRHPHQHCDSKAVEYQCHMCGTLHKGELKLRCHFLSKLHWGVVVSRLPQKEAETVSIDLNNVKYEVDMEKELEVEGTPTLVEDNPPDNDCCCCYCARPFTERTQLLRHLTKRHSRDFFAKCLKPETTRKEVAAAIEAALSSIIVLNVNNDKCIYQCPQCTGARYTKRPECSFHILVTHPDDVFSTLKIQDGPSIKTSVIDEFSCARKGVRCELCGVVTGGLRSHMLANHPYFYYKSKLPKGTSEQQFLETLDSLTKMSRTIQPYQQLGYKTRRHQCHLCEAIFADETKMKCHFLSKLHWGELESRLLNQDPQDASSTYLNKDSSSSNTRFTHFKTENEAQEKPDVENVGKCEVDICEQVDVETATPVEDNHQDTTDPLVLEQYTEVQEEPEKMNNSASSTVCPYCSRQCGNEPDLHEHILVIHMLEVFPTLIGTTTQHLRLALQRLTIRLKGNNVYKCRHCPEMQGIHLLTYHLRDCHMREVLIELEKCTQEDWPTCPHCGIKIMELDQHVQIQHTFLHFSSSKLLPPGTSEAALEASINKVVKQHKKARSRKQDPTHPVQCPCCSTKFKSVNDLRVHIIMKHFSQVLIKLNSADSDDDDDPLKQEYDRS